MGDMQLPTELHGLRPLLRASACAVWVLACGGRSSGGDGSGFLEEGAAQGNGGGEASVQPPSSLVGAARGGPGSIDASSQQAISCAEANRAIWDFINAAAEAAPKSCDVDEQCTAYRRSPRCLLSCGFAVAVRDGSAIDEAIDQVDAEMCRRECRPPINPCNINRREAPRCIDGACVMYDPNP